VVTVDGLRPSSTQSPRSPGELAAALKEAAGEGRAVVPIGGGRALGMGDTLERFDLAL
jgi:hypothetical protein